MRSEGSRICRGSINDIYAQSNCPCRIVNIQNDEWVNISCVLEFLGPLEFIDIKDEDSTYDCQFHDEISHIRQEHHAARKVRLGIGR